MKGFVIFANGFAQDHNVLEQTALERTIKPNIDKLTELGCSGVLHIRNLGTKDSNQISIEEFEQLLGIYGSNESLPAKLEHSYHNLKIGIVTNNQDLRVALCKNHSVNENDVVHVSVDHESSQVEQISEAVEQLFKSDHDLVIFNLSLHNYAKGEEGEKKFTLRSEGISFLDQVLNSVTKQRENLYLSVIMTHGGPLTALQLQKEQEKATNVKQRQQPSYGFPFPLQSFQILAGKRIENVRFLYPMIASYYHETETRKDNAKRFTERECERGANLSILADHFLPEIGYKLGYTSKYGA
jgi:2,3-bisphosphoglycerate-independent phosphoglycerate mutase